MRISDWSSDVCSSDLGAIVADVRVGEQLDEPLTTEVGDPVDLLAPPGPLDDAGVADPGAEGGQLAHEGAGHGSAGHGGALLHGLPAALGLQPGQRPVQRAETSGEGRCGKEVVRTGG